MSETVDLEDPGATPAAASGVPAQRERPLDVLIALTRSDLRARYGRGASQLVKWVLEPVALVGVYLLLRVVIFDRGGHAVGLSIACSIVPFQIVLLSTGSAMNCVSFREPILLNMRFNRMLLPLSSLLTETLAFGASFGLLALMMILYGVAPTWWILLLPVVVAATVALAIGIAYPAALVGVWFPDARLFAIQFLRILYFAAPGLVALSEIHGRAHELFKLNPLTGLFEAYRDIILFGRAPSFWMLLYPVGVGLVLLLIFVPIYRREQNHFAKVIGA
ncbi:MAG: lipopolysaccharide transport system permease protein [Gaiellaceae bacterium]|jgi:ABC-type polysaccharide/polyol phosphate export permease|nr:lipopolysaccharide transport system permease protein [Gaiellaceae bacterium]